MYFCRINYVMPFRLSIPLLLVLALASPGLVRAEKQKILEPLPIADVFPLAGSNSCGCSIYRKGSEMSPSNAMLSTIAFADDPKVSTRIRIDGKTVEFSKISRVKEGNIGVNRYRSNNIVVEVRYKIVSYRQFCSAYTDAPTEGSCSVGTVAATNGVEKEMFPMVQVCGC